MGNHRGSTERDTSRQDGRDQPPGRGEGATNGTVLIADDDQDLVETIKIWFEDEWTVLEANDGVEAIKTYGPHVDVVLLDRRMPTKSGAEVLREIRERDGRARIAMLTAVSPEWDIIDMEFDMYLEKPIDQGELREAIETLMSRTTYAREIRALFRLSSKLGILQSRYPAQKLNSDERYLRLKAEFERLHRQSQDQLRDLSQSEFQELLQVIEEPSRPMFENGLQFECDK
ncbi:MAG: response regulator [Halobacteriaceae archaeon]